MSHTAAEQVGNGPRTIMYREGLNEAIREEMQRDASVFIMGEGIGERGGSYKVTEGLQGQFSPERVIDTPITEQGFAGVGVGAAFAGLKPIVEFMTWNFAMQAIDQIINDPEPVDHRCGAYLHIAGAEREKVHGIAPVCDAADSGKR